MNRIILIILITFFFFYLTILFILKIEKKGENLNPEFLHWDLKYAVNDLEANGFSTLVQKEEFQLEQFKSVEALVYYLKAVPWQVPGISIEKYFNRLLEIYHDIQLKGSFDVKMHRFLIFAQNK